MEGREGTKAEREHQNQHGSSRAGCKLPHSTHKGEHVEGTLILQKMLHLCMEQHGVISTTGNNTAVLPFRGRWKRDSQEDAQMK